MLTVHLDELVNGHLSIVFFIFFDVLKRQKETQILVFNKAKCTHPPNKTSLIQPKLVSYHRNQQDAAFLLTGPTHSNKSCTEIKMATILLPQIFVRLDIYESGMNVN